jgi:hypothetical protein
VHQQRLTSLVSWTGKAWQSVEDLESVAQRLQERGLMVVEPPEASFQITASPFLAPPPPLSEVFPDADRSQSHTTASTAQVRLMHAVQSSALGLLARTRQPGGLLSQG